MAAPEMTKGAKTTERARGCGPELLVEQEGKRRAERHRQHDRAIVKTVRVEEDRLGVVPAEPLGRSSQSRWLACGLLMFQSVKDSRMFAEQRPVDEDEEEREVRDQQASGEQPFTLRPARRSGGGPNGTRGSRFGRGGRRRTSSRVRNLPRPQCSPVNSR